MVDRGFLAAGILVPLARDGKNRHWMTRAKATTKWRVVEHLGKNEDLVELTISREARKQDPSLPATYLARAITLGLTRFGGRFSYAAFFTECISSNLIGLL